MPEKTEVILVGGGQGRRMGGTQPKAVRMLGGRPLFTYALAAFSQVAEIHSVVLVAPAGLEEEVRRICGRFPGGERVRNVVPGGARRQDSVRQGLDHLLPETTVVLVHDAARPFADPELIRRVQAAAARHGAAVPGIPVADTLKRVTARSLVETTVDRRQLVAVQTPQGFRTEVLRRAHAHAWKTNQTATDDAGMVENLGVPVTVVEGDPRNFKLTTPQDLALAEAWQSRQER